MTTALVAGIIAALGIVGAQVALLFWQLRRNSDATDQALSTTKENGELNRRIDAQTRAIADRDGIIKELESNVERLNNALETVKEQRDKLLEEALANGEPSTVAAAVRNAAERLKRLRSEVSEVSSDTSTDNH